MKNQLVTLFMILSVSFAADNAIVDKKNGTETTNSTNPGKPLVFPPGPSGTNTSTSTTEPSPTPITVTVDPPTTTTTAPNASTTTKPPTTTSQPPTTTSTKIPTTTNATTSTQIPTTSKATPTPSPPTKNPTTKAPSTTTAPAPAPSNRKFDGPSFVGGIVLASGLIAIGFVAFKFYKARTELNYHTL